MVFAQKLSECSMRCTLLAGKSGWVPWRLHLEISSITGALLEVTRACSVVSIDLIRECQRKESKPRFGNPAKLDLLPPNSRGFATSAHAKCAVYRLGSKRSRLPGNQVPLGSSKAITPACEHNGPNALLRLHDAPNNVNRYFALFNCSIG